MEKMLNALREYIDRHFEHEYCSRNILYPGTCVDERNAMEQAWAKVEEAAYKMGYGVNKLEQRRKMYDLVRIEKVRAAEGFWFVCPSCGAEHSDWDYLRVWLGDNPTPMCIHLMCLLAKVGFTEAEVEKLQNQGDHGLD